MIFISTCLEIRIIDIITKTSTYDTDEEQDNKDKENDKSMNKTAGQHYSTFGRENCEYDILPVVVSFEDKDKIEEEERQKYKV